MGDSHAGDGLGPRSIARRATLVQYSVNVAMCLCLLFLICVGFGLRVHVPVRAAHQHVMWIRFPCGVWIPNGVRAVLYARPWRARCTRLCPNGKADQRGGGGGTKLPQEYDCSSSSDRDDSKGLSGNEEESSSDGDAPLLSTKTRSAPPGRRLANVRAELTGRKVLVPAAEWPDEECDGAGWLGTVRCRSSPVTCHRSRSGWTGTRTYFRWSLSCSGAGCG
eukprot:scaffold2782_cov112-Isochrysis_galbana.AAC.8